MILVVTHVLPITNMESHMQTHTSMCNVSLCPFVFCSFYVRIFIDGKEDDDLGFIMVGNTGNTSVYTPRTRWIHLDFVVNSNDLSNLLKSIAVRPQIRKSRTIS